MTTLTTENPTAESRPHTYGAGLGHDAMIHLDHVDHLQDGYAHRDHGGQHHTCATCSCAAGTDTCASCA